MHNNRVPRRTHRSLATATVLTAAAALAAAPLFSASAFAAHESAPGSISRLEPAKPAQLTGSAEWGLRQSFRSYIKTGPAHGSWELLDGATGEFNFPVDDGQSITADTPGTITFKGGVHFTGHDGQLDITIANPVVKFTGPDTADLLLNVKSKAMGAADVTDYGQIEFAKLSNITIQHDGEKKLTVKAPKVALTAKGAQGFANFYKEGTELDPFSFEINETAAPSPTPTPSPTDPAPSPKPTDPAPSPSPTDPAPSPKPTDPAPSPSPTDPAPSPSPTDPAPSPKPTDPAPSPSPTDPAPSPSPTDPAPSPKPTDPAPSPEPTPNPSPSNPTPKPPADNSQKPIADPCLADDACNLYFADQFPASIAKLGMKIPAGGEVIAGDWDGDGVSTVAIRNGENYTFYDSNRSDAKTTAATFPGTGSGQVLVADFNGDKKDDIAVKNGNVFSIKYNATASGAADITVPYGKASDRGLAGDWDGDGKATLGVRRGYINLLRDTLTGGEADRTFAYGRSDDVAFVGDWNGDGKDTVSVRRGATLFVKNALSGGDADTSFTYGRASDKLVVGDWTGTGKDTVAVVREQAKGGLG